MKVTIEFSKKAIEQFDVKHGLENCDVNGSGKDVIKALGVAMLVEKLQKDDLTVNLDNFKSKAEDDKYRIIVSNLLITLGCIKAVTAKDEEKEEENKE